MDVQKGSGEQSPSRQNKHGTSARNRSSGNQWQNGVVSKQDGISNGFLHTNQADSDSKYSDSRREKVMHILFCIVLKIFTHAQTAF